MQELDLMMNNVVAANFIIPQRCNAEQLHVYLIKDKDKDLSIRIYLLARRNLLWDILRLPSSRRAALGLYVILTI